MKFTRKKEDTGTIRKVWGDDKEICYGVVGTVGDLLQAKILKYSDYPPETWAFIPDLGIMQRAGFGATRKAALAHLPQ